MNRWFGWFQSMVLPRLGLIAFLQINAQDRKLTDVLATQGWQDSGVTLREGMPVQIEVKGSWKVVFETGPEGLELPNELRPKDNRIKLGTLIGVIANTPVELNEGQPFVVTSGMSFNAKKQADFICGCLTLIPRTMREKCMC